MMHIRTILKTAAVLALAVLSISFIEGEVEPYYVFSDNWIHGIPTGFMGEKNGESMKIESVCKDKPYKGENCVKIVTTNKESWRGLHIQYTGSWNVALKDDAKLPDLSAYNTLEFYARAEETGDGPYLLQDIGVGGGGSPEDKVSDSYLEVDTEWKKFSISLKGHDFKRVNTMLYMVLPVGTIYFDEIRFIKK
ncbi:MAG: hypothetical protein ACKOXB_15235 [Flavobacteriales bacterium]